MIGAVLKRETSLTFRNLAEVATQLLFALLITMLFPLALGGEPGMLAKLAPGLLTLALLLSCFLGFERLFSGDFEEGSLDIIAQSKLPLPLYALIKTLARWVGYALPLIIISPLLAFMLGMAATKLTGLTLALLLASLALYLAGMAAGALTLGARRGFLLPLLLGPLCLPVLVFCVALAENGLDEAAGRQAALFLGSLCFFYLCLFTPLTGAALKSAVESA
jgi:heme exporter protein B